MASFIFGTIGFVVGFLVNGFWGAIAGLVIGFVVAAAVAFGGKAKPPSQAASTSQDPSETLIATKLVQVKKLHEQGLLSEEEYASKKAELLARL